MADFLGKEDDVGVDSNFGDDLVVVSKADVFVVHDGRVFNQQDECVDELAVLVRFVGEGINPGQCGFDVHVPKGADEFFEGWFLFG